MKRDKAVTRRMESETEPAITPTGEVCFDMMIFDEAGKWLGSGGSWPLSWIRATDAADEGLREFLRAARKVLDK